MVGGPASGDVYRQIKAEFLARLLETLSQDGGEAIWDAAFQIGYVRADEPRTTDAAVMTGTDRRR